MSHEGLRAWTVGHSTRPLAELVALLDAHGIEQLADVRTVPRSRRNPQFNIDTLPATFAAAGIAYRHLKTLALQEKAADNPYVRRCRPPHGTHIRREIR